jgi:TPR repeat protein
MAVDYAKALYWYYKAAAQGNSDAENQLGWMYQYGQGVKQSNANALAWYQLAADQGNVKGQNNLQAFSDELEDEGNNSADAPVDDAAIDQARRRARSQYLRARIDGLEADALSQDREIQDLEHMGKGKRNAIGKVMDALGNTISVSPRLQAQKDREEASRLRDELAGIENEHLATASAPAP